MEGTPDCASDDMPLPARKPPRDAAAFVPLGVRGFGVRGVAFRFRDELAAWRAESTAWSWCASAMLSAPSGGSEAPLRVAVVRTPAPRTISPERKRSARRSDGVGMVRTMSPPDRKQRHRCVAARTKTLRQGQPMGLPMGLPHGLPLGLPSAGHHGLRVTPASAAEQALQNG